MPQPAVACAPPFPSAIAPYLPGAHFHDAWCVPAADPSLSAFGQFLRMARATPGWVDALMRLRNRAVALVGLKDLGGLAQVDATRPEADYRPGDRVGIFTLISSGPDELLVGDSDRHLDVVLSLHVARSAAAATLTLTTVVHVHNLLGRVYMLPVAPAHRRIVPATLRAVAA